MLGDELTIIEEIKNSSNSIINQKNYYENNKEAPNSQMLSHPKLIHINQKN